MLSTELATAGILHDVPIQKFVCRLQNMTRDSPEGQADKPTRYFYPNQRSVQNG